MTFVPCPFDDIDYVLETYLEHRDEEATARADASDEGEERSIAIQEAREGLTDG